MHVKLSADGTTLATATFQTSGGFGYFQLWDVATGLPLTDPVAERGYVISIAIQPDGGAVSAGWTNGVVQTLRIPPRQSVPAWFPEVAEAVAGQRLAAETGTLEKVPDEELATLREKVLAGDAGMGADPDWFLWAKWLVRPRRTHGRSRGEDDGGTVDCAAEGCRQYRGSPPGGAPVPDRRPPFARLATRYQAIAGSDLGSAKQHWEDTAVCTAIGRSRSNQTIPTYGRCGVI